MNFVDWICEKKEYSKRSAMDVESRLRRVKDIVGERINNKTLENLEKNEDFTKLSVSVKSQMRKAIRLYNEYKGE